MKIPPTARFLFLLLVATCGGAGSAETYDDDLRSTVNLGFVLPHTELRRKAYTQDISDAIRRLEKSTWPPFAFVQHFKIQHHINVAKPVPSPADIFDCLCDRFFKNNVSLVVYIFGSQNFGQDTAAVQYFTQMVNYLKVPTISWNAANYGIEKKISDSVVLQLAPSIKHQANAMLDILQRFEYKWFAVMTSHVAGHNEFKIAIDERIKEVNNDQVFGLIDYALVDTTNESDVTHRLSQLKTWLARIVLLHATTEEAVTIFKCAKRLDMTGHQFLWLVTDAIVGPDLESFIPLELPIGLLGIHTDVSYASYVETLKKAIAIFGHGLDLFLDDPVNANVTDLAPDLSCDGESKQWSLGKHFYRYLKNVSVEWKSPSYMEGKKFDRLEFNEDGTLKRVALHIVNLARRQKWRKVGMWTEGRLHIDGIKWPGDRLTPPSDSPDRYHLRVTFLEEPPYVKMRPQNNRKKCSKNTVECKIPPAQNGHDPTGVATNYTQVHCCSGLTIDLLQMLSKDMRFNYELKRVEDGLWGIRENGTWNGLIAELIQGKTDVVVTSLKINEERARAVDFSVPFLETGIAIAVAKRTGIISPKAFLEPFDVITWLFIFAIGIQATAVTIFCFEWFSPSGYNRDIDRGKDGRNLSLFRTYWLVWSLLLRAAVNINCPHGLASRFMAHLWAAFAVVFVAIYTANLAAFMITEEEFYNLNGVKDERLLKPFRQKPPLKFGTIPAGYTASLLKVMFNDEVNKYMKHYSRPTVAQGISAVKQGELDAFIYDATVLDYLAGQDDECRLLTVGQWYAMTGYGFAFPRKSEFIKIFNKWLITYKNNGTLERLNNFWLAGACHKDSSKSSSSSHIAFEQYISAFILLLAGVVLSFIILVVEKCYYVYIRKKLAKNAPRRNSIVTLVSWSLGRSLIPFEEVVDHAMKANNIYKSHKCKDPICDTVLWKARHERDLYKFKAEYLESQLREITTQNHWQNRDVSTKL